MLELETRQAFVLHSRPFKENQALVELLVADEGRVSVIARKGGQKNSARNALLQPFRPVKVKYKPKAGLKTLKQIDPDDRIQASAYTLNGTSLFCGFYLNEVLCRLCAADEYQPDLYPLYVFTLNHLNVAASEQAHVELCLRQFEFNLLNLLGYGISFEEDIESIQPLVTNRLYHLLPDSGFVPSFDNNGYWGRDILAVNQLLTETISAEQLSQMQQQGRYILKLSKQLLSICMHRHLGNKPLKSRELFRRQS